MKYDVLLPSRRQIRLLTLQASRRFKDPIQCSLHTVSLDDEPEFWALSYVWGNSFVTVDITVDGSPAEATTNLASALRHIRRAFGQVVIWVDAVCINQKDDEEKGKQVQMMGTIYTKAAKVIGWLGPEADNSRLALSTLRGIARAKMDYILSMCAAGRWDDVAQATSADAERNHLDWLREAPQLGPKFWWGGNLRSVGLLIKRGDWKHLAWTLYPKFAVLSPAWKALSARLLDPYMDSTRVCPGHESCPDVRPRYPRTRSNRVAFTDAEYSASLRTRTTSEMDGQRRLQCF